MSNEKIKRETIELFDDIDINTLMINGHVCIPHEREQDLYELEKQELINLDYDLKYKLTEDFNVYKFFTATLTDEGKEYLKLYKEYKQL